VRFIDLFAGLGGFHLALSELGHRCVFACEIDADLASLYEENFGIEPESDIRDIHEGDIPKHDILCAGFPCQPWSKAGDQLGAKCPRWGDLFSRHVLRIIRHHTPKYLILENVANLQRHKKGRTWIWMRSQLEKCGYTIDAKVLSPHRYGVPQIRQRLFVVGARKGLANFTWPTDSDTPPSLYDVIEDDPDDGEALSKRVVKCLNTWQEFLKLAPADELLPSFPIWRGVSPRILVLTAEGRGEILRAWQGSRELNTRARSIM